MDVRTTLPRGRPVRVEGFEVQGRAGQGSLSEEKTKRELGSVRDAELDGVSESTPRVAGMAEWVRKCMDGGDT